MGASFTNLQLLRRSQGPAIDSEALVAALNCLLEAEGFVTCARDEVADRTLLVDMDPPSSPRWIIVYDEASDAHVADALTNLARGLSNQLATHVVSVVVYGGWMLELRLFERGEELDRYNSAPEYVGVTERTERKRLAGHCERWEPLLVPGAATAALKGVWKARGFAPATLAETSKCFGWSLEAVNTGFRYASRDGGSFLKLTYRSRVPLPKSTPTEGAPVFGESGGSFRVDLELGQELTFQCSARNLKGKSTGFSVVVGGEAFSSGLASFSALEVSVGGGPSLAAPLEERTNAKGEPVRVAAFPAVDLPANVAAGLSSAHYDPRTEGALRDTSTVRVTLRGTATAVGTATLYVVFVPHENSAGAHAYGTRMDVVPRLRRPLRASPTAFGRVVRDLSGAETLFALVSFDANRPAAADFIERWGALFDHGRGLQISSIDAADRPSLARAKRKGFFESERWQRLKQATRGEILVSLEQPCPGVLYPRPRSHGATYDTMPAAVPDDDPRLPTLAIWIDAKEASEERIAASTRLARELMDEAMDEHGGVQALCARWNWSPGLVLEATPYELACNVMGGITLHRSWLSRYVRGVAVGTLWLSRPLAESIPDRAALEAVARVDSASTGSLRITVEHADSLDAVEAALAPLLPTAEDAKAALRARAARRR